MGSEVAVVGGGLTGLSMALALVKADRNVVLFDPDAERKDARTTAMLGPTVEFLEGLGVWSGIEPSAAPLRAMRIIDGSRRLVRAPTVTFDASEIGRTEFGYNVPNQVAHDALRDAIRSDGRITLVEQPVTEVAVDGTYVELRATDETTHRVALVVGADGRRSRVRKAINVPVRSHDYPQTALVTTFSHDLPHENMSTEFHTETGPATQVPLPGNRSSLVWVLTPTDAERLAGTTREDLSHAVEERLGSFLGEVEIDGPVQSFPLSTQLASQYGGNRAMLVGEAAHAFPPIGAQGFNLSIRDVHDATSAQLAALDPGAPEVIALYRARRQSDAYVRTAGVHAMNQTLLSGLLPVQLAKAGALTALKTIQPLRSLVIREGFEPTPIPTRSEIGGEVLVRLRRGLERLANREPA